MPQRGGPINNTETGERKAEKKRETKNKQTKDIHVAYSSSCRVSFAFVLINQIKY